MEHRLRAQKRGATKGPAKPPANGTPVVCLTEITKPVLQAYSRYSGTSRYPRISPQTRRATNSYYSQSLSPMDPTHIGSKPKAVYKLSIPVKHTTAAHKLLTWPSI
ncbi:unnamed protein product [Penicillium camemberti]|uniref:Str. FM013 n=1 Tax=Penicillium camemberti (strain FM 013) TaxID=1429867 RepID=A0A0G4PQW0_PENC3|nr:unnamed protein product [Penicillium camemberti]